MVMRPSDRPTSQRVGMAMRLHPTRATRSYPPSGTMRPLGGRWIMWSFARGSSNLNSVVVSLA